MVQLADYLNNFVRLDFGDSLRYRMPAGMLFQARFPRTVALASVVLAIAFPLSLLLGILAGLRPLSVIDRVISVVSFGGISIPPFWLGLMLIIVFAVQIGPLPTSGFGGFTGWQYYVMPAAALAIRPIGRLAQLTRSSLVDEMAKQYVTTARAKGLSEPRVIRVHALKNAMSSLSRLAQVRLYFPQWLGRNRDHIRLAGHWLTDDKSITARPVCSETCVVAVGIIVVFANLAVDILYAYFDPRIVYK